MAEVTWDILTIPEAALTCTWDDVTRDLVRFNLITSIAVHIRIWRTGRTPWREFDLQPGSYEYAAGGPVQNWDDVDLVEMAAL